MSEPGNRLQAAGAFGDDRVTALKEQHGAWDFGDLDGYIREGEPERAERAENWATAIGLQAVDGLQTSAYLMETAREHIEGRIDIAEAQRRIRSYYDEREGREELEGEQEADIVSSRIAELLGERAFTFSPTELCDIHRRLFNQVLPRAGKYRNYNITKKEWVLKGGTVYYATYGTIADTLRYDFEQERAFSYTGLSEDEVVRHFAQFVSSIWQIHPFGEGNTRTTAVFAIKYLRTMGYEVNNEPFKAHSWYFRNALVRANYEDVTRGVAPTTRYLELFFENLLCGASNELKNRYLHLDWDGLPYARVPASEPMNSQKHPESALLIGAAQSVWDGSDAVVTIQIEVATKLRIFMREYGMEQLGAVFITDSDIRHIKRGHTKNEEERGQLPITPSDFGCLPEILNEFDTCEQTDTDKLGNKKFLVTKLIDNKYYVVTIQRGKKKLEVKTMWKRPGASC